MLSSRTWGHDQQHASASLARHRTRSLCNEPDGRAVCQSQRLLPRQGRVDARGRPGRRHASGHCYCRRRHSSCGGLRAVPSIPETTQHRRLLLRRGRDEHRHVPRGRQHRRHLGPARSFRLRKQPLRRVNRGREGDEGETRERASGGIRYPRRDPGRQRRRGCLPRDGAGGSSRQGRRRSDASRTRDLQARRPLTQRSRALPRSRGGGRVEGTRPHRGLRDALAGRRAAQTQSCG